MLIRAIMAMMPPEERQRGRFITPLERDMLEGVARRKAIRVAYQEAQR